MNKPTKLQPAEYVCQTYHHMPGAGATLEHVLEPGYWAHVAKTLRAGDHIEVLAEDGSWWAMLLVRYTGRTEVAVAVLFAQQFEEVEIEGETDSEYLVKWAGPRAKFRVQRGTEVIRDEFESKAAAENWLKGHLKALAA